MLALRNLPFLLIGIPAVLAFSAEDKPDPAKIKDKVKITIGKQLFVKFEQKDNALSDPKVVEKEGDLTPTFDFSKMDQNVTLTTKNPFKKNLKFRALARLKGKKNYFETSIVPVLPGLFGIELWQDDIEELILFEFKLEDEKEKAKDE